MIAAQPQWTSTGRNACFALALVFSLVPDLSGGEDEPPDLAARMLAFRADFATAAPATRSRVLTELRDDLSAQPVRFDGLITGFSGFTLPDGEQAERGETMMGWRHQGHYVHPHGCGDASRKDCAALAARRLRTVLPGGDDATMVMVRKDRILFYALTQDQELVDRLRSGREVRIVVWVQGMLDETVFGVLDAATMIESVGSCDNNHRYPADSGFRFCPKCGHEIVYD